MKLTKMAIGVISVTALLAGSAIAASQDGKTTLRIQTHFSETSPNGEAAARFIDNIQVMSGGDISVEMFYNSSVVKSAETFDAAITGILDCDMTGGAYQVGKDPAFQFVGDIMGGYTTPYQQLSWLYKGGGLEAAQELYGQYNMHLVGWWIPGPESLSSIRPIRNAADFKNWKFRSPPGLETKIFDKMGASPIVMDFTEVFTALESGIIDGADASSLTTNKSLGLYDIAKHATYPGFHSMPSDHLACRKDMWDSMPEAHRRIMSVAMQSTALDIATTIEKANLETAAELRKAGVTLHAWAEEDLNAFRAAAQSAWDDYATTPAAKALVKSHKAYLAQLGLLQ